MIHIIEIMEEKGFPSVLEELFTCKIWSLSSLTFVEGLIYFHFTKWFTYFLMLKMKKLFIFTDNFPSIRKQGPLLHLLFLAPSQLFARACCLLALPGTALVAWIITNVLCFLNYYYYLLGRVGLGDRIDTACLFSTIFLRTGDWSSVFSGSPDISSFLSEISVPS